MKSLMKKVLIILSMMLLALSCSKMADVPVVDLAKLTADYEARDGITALGDATLVLEGNNIVRGFESSFPGIFVPEGKTLTITGAGKLDVSGNGYAPGIGSEDEYGKNCGNIVVQGGTIRATGGQYSAGIGSGCGMSCGDITISGGTVTTLGGPSAAGIGSGYHAKCGNISISACSLSAIITISLKGNSTSPASA